MPTKYIFVTGGVVSSLGKGLTAASIAMLLEKRKLKVEMLKLDPYLNVDPGTMNPFEHGEVYVTDDGAETDLDLGHYYRFTESTISKNSNVTSGQIYDAVIKQERRGDYQGKTVQVVPHVTDEIKRRILRVANSPTHPDVVMIEIGGTVGDIESLPFLEAIRQFRLEHFDNCLNIHLTYVPYLSAAGEVKTKPSQHSIQTLRGIGIIPDMILCRCEQPLPSEIKNKISLFCSVKREFVMDEVDVKDSIYEVPLSLHEQEVDLKVIEFLKLPLHDINLSHWESMVHKLKNPVKKIKIGVVGKYMQFQEAYKSVFEALSHAAIDQEMELEICPFESDKIEDYLTAQQTIQGCDGYLVPGGFGKRGWMGKIFTAQYCRENNIPYFGICLGLQVMCVEFAKHVLHLTEANSTEMDPYTPHPVICLLNEQKGIEQLGGTMRLGAYPCHLKEGSKAMKAYGVQEISERHRHRFEVNQLFKTRLQDQGLIVSGLLPGRDLCEIVELTDHPWMVGVQFHPEFKSKPGSPHPLFQSFIKAAFEHRIRHG
ncbi:CTP synthase [Rhabdochlamydiaceae symbiont of Dictyostelium giganteum]|uniref:CTP synthase n=1 Tax=Rhabdochlamydiaceae symbiont of Dictyostelium giganteum TaxID=3342349 RepID=UPI00384A8C68